jgi:hypothetical protein
MDYFYLFSTMQFSFICILSLILVYVFGLLLMVFNEIYLHHVGNRWINTYHEGLLGVIMITIYSLAFNIFPVAWILTKNGVLSLLIAIIIMFVILKYKSSFDQIVFWRIIIFAFVFIFFLQDDTFLETVHTPPNIYASAFLTSFSIAHFVLHIFCYFVSFMYFFNNNLFESKN